MSCVRSSFTIEELPNVYTVSSFYSNPTSRFATHIFVAVTVCTDIKDEHAFLHARAHIFFGKSSPRCMFTVHCTRMSRLFTDAHTEYSSEH